ncbi:hypothetical protein [Phormidium sp. CCY1219]|uniref:hypothetical protein n=1 Tax=Phormidium sp. CCY1219 TaxID=2886104 RepID=UPI002D1F56F3|nr:hypothetical protein [Phormidium sp. CCY1219]MEB3829121.1 hypothetical protein [Phormidium sp. CCY1219]
MISHGFYSSIFSPARSQTRLDYSSLLRSALLLAYQSCSLPDIYTKSDRLA